ncbi:MAG: endolytic transglycosylase MltG [Bacteroidales bacterium]|nr:endolytic transglycosylase MltG [Bacteroidales bacterium]
MKKTLITLATLLAVAGALATAAVLLAGHRTANTAPARLFLPPGTSLDAMCDSLRSAGILDGTATFRTTATLCRMVGSTTEGSYLVQPATTTWSLVRKLRNRQQDPIMLTIGKFRTPEQLDAYLGTKLMHDDFATSLDSFHIVRPDTYEVYWTTSPAQLHGRLLREYDRFWQRRGVDSTATCCGVVLTRRDIIVLASIVEEETNNAAEKPLVASVYLNRLRQGIPLQADPTVKYAVGDFTLRRILNKHLQTESPFNTYLHAGLPPAPICLPSAASVDAVLRAPSTGYLYFCASDALDGTHRFATTLSAHQRNASLFHAALNRLGIR